MTTSRESFHASQAKLQQDRSGRAEHTVSVSPMGTVTDGTWTPSFEYRAHCTCGMRSSRLDTMSKGEEWARVHRQSVQEPRTASKTPKVPTDSTDAAPRADEGAV